jgi:RND family efflux transporter MFP subunit
MNTRSFAGLVIVLVTSLLLYGVAKGEARLPPAPARVSPTPVKVLTAYTAAEVPEFPGRVEAGESALLAFRVAGQIQAMSVRMGDTVQPGQVLAELDPTDYRLRLEARQAEFDLAQLGAERASTLYAKKLISEDQFDTAQTLLATSRARLEQAKEQLSFCQLKAPFVGNIAFTYAMPSEIVGPQQAVINLQDTSSLEIHFNLPPRYQPLLNANDRATFGVSSELLPGVQLQARYKEAGMRPDPDTNSYPVTLTVAPDGGQALWPGMPARVQLQHPTLFTGKWMPPAEALFERSGDSAHVWRIDDDTMTIKRVAVQLNASGVLLGGLQPGDRIVAAGVDRLREGQKVRAWVREGGL